MRDNMIERNIKFFGYLDHPIQATINLLHLHSSALKCSCNVHIVNHDGGTFNRKVG